MKTKGLGIIENNSQGQKETTIEEPPLLKMLRSHEGSQQLTHQNSRLVCNLSWVVKVVLGIKSYVGQDQVKDVKIRRNIVELKIYVILYSST